MRAGTAKSITDAQFQIARLYGFPSWPKLKAYVDSLDQIGQLKQAIDTNDLVFYASMTVFFLFLCARVLDSARWRG